MVNSEQLIGDESHSHPAKASTLYTKGEPGRSSAVEKLRSRNLADLVGVWTRQTRGLGDLV